MFLHPPWGFGWKRTRTIESAARYIVVGRVIGRIDKVHRARWARGHLVAYSIGFSVVKIRSIGSIGSIWTVSAGRTAWRIGATRTASTDRRFICVVGTAVRPTCASASALCACRGSSKGSHGLEGGAGGGFSGGLAATARKSAVNFFGRATKAQKSIMTWARCPTITTGIQFWVQHLRNKCAGCNAGAHQHVQQ